MVTFFNRLCVRLKNYAARRPVRAALIVAAALFVINIFRFLVWPPMTALAENNPATTAFMEYRQNQWRRQGREVEARWDWKRLDQISPHLRQAVVVSEDSAFWSHDGFDWQGIRLAMSRNLAEGRFSAGGSTISQQLAKNLYFSPEKSLVRKAQEAIVTWRMEKSLEKERILEIYLNVVEWGDGIYGAEAAARHYFKTSAARLTKRQAATLAAMLPNPLGRSPSSKRVQTITRIILRRMR